MYVLILVSIYRLYPKTKANNLYKSFRKNFFLSACYCSDKSISVREVDQKFLIGGKISYGDSYSDSVFCYSKVFRLYVLLHDAAGAVRSQTGKGPGYCYTIGRRPNSCLLGHVTKLVFCLYVELFLASIFNSINVGNSLYLFVVEKKRDQKSIRKELGPFIDGNIQGFSLCPPKSTKLIIKQHGAFIKCMALKGAVENSNLAKSLMYFTT